ncbi:general transcription factor 3C polypeptide 5 [Coccinella septempunctata]|uniref:general transcription factor 3C polypeptide 5 n=1 Tax=Coccinella septempunctata TaxID=41139 RepID=UPI001D07596B|nr:general transcription factor 3C polypeptide 5 [Coccinella septempunctata]
MSDEENSEKSFRTLESLKQVEQEKPTEKNTFFSSLIDEDCDESCIHIIKQRLVRIQYPGIVKNLEKAVETLGGLEGISKAVARNKLELNFHPKNKYNKGVLADTNTNSGLLVKVKKQQRGNEAPIWTYEIVGATVKNFVFSKFIDFQYLPLVAEYPETRESRVNYIYDSILPNKIPDIHSILKSERMFMPLFLPPFGFARSDIQKKINPVVKQPNDIDFKVLQKKKEKLSVFAKPKQPSIFHKFHEPEIPEKPTDFISQLVSRRNYHEYLLKLEKLFHERPIWTKNGLRFNSHLSNDLLKVLLPAVAYYELSGPWRCTWIRFGYDPRKDPESKKYQNLDYRIPYSVRTNLKIGSNRLSQPKGLPTSLDKLDKNKGKSRRYVYDENSYKLRPNVLPTARQVFYQYCDILLPEVQIMLSRLPPVSANAQCDPKNGWFPSSFVEQCREIVTKYIDQQAGNVLRKQRELIPPNPIEDLFNRTQKLVEQKTSEMKAEAGPSTSDDNFDVFTIYDSDSDESTGCEKFYQENDLYDLVDELDDPLLYRDEQLAEINQILRT